MQFKVTIHCGQVNTFQFEDADNKDHLLDKYQILAFGSEPRSAIRFGDLLINSSLISFIVVEEVQEMAAPVEPVTIEA